MRITTGIRNAAAAIGRAADKFTPWARDIELAEAHQARLARLLAAQADHKAARTMTDITNDHNEGRISRAEYERQYNARLAEVGVNAFWDEITAPGAPALELTDAEIDRIDADREAAEQEAIEDESRPGGPLWNPETGEPYDQATQDRMINEARYPEQAEETGESWPSYQEMTQDERLEYLGDRAAEMEGGSTEVHDRMAGDGVPASDRARAAEAAMSWTTAAAESEAEAAAEDPENADQAALNALEPEVSTAVQVTAPDGSRFVTRDPDLEAVQRAYRVADGYSCELVTGWHNAEPVAEPELEPGTDPENADQAALNAPDPRRGWYESPDRPGELLDLHEADPEAAAGLRFVGADEARSRALAAINEHRQLTDAQLAGEAGIDDAVAEADHGARERFTASPAASREVDRNVNRRAVPPGATPVISDNGAEVHVVDPAQLGAFLDAVNAGAYGEPEGGQQPYVGVTRGVKPVTASSRDLSQEPIPYELTELGAGQATADAMTEREVGPGYLDAEAEAGR